MFRFQVKIEERQNGQLVQVWRDVHPTRGPAYEYKTREEAERMARMCYQGQAEWRVYDTLTGQ